MNKKSLKIVIGVFLIIIVILVAMILLKGKNLNPFAKEDGNGTKIESGEGGIYQDFISVPSEGSSSFNLESGGEGADKEGGMFKQEIGE